MMQPWPVRPKGKPIKAGGSWQNHREADGSFDFVEGEITLCSKK